MEHDPLDRNLERLITAVRRRKFPPLSTRALEDEIGKSEVPVTTGRRAWFGWKP